MFVGFCAAFLNPLIFAAACLVGARFVGAQGVPIERVVGAMFLLLSLPMLASASASALHRFILPGEKSISLALLAGVAAMYLELHSEPFLKVAFLITEQSTGLPAGALSKMALAFLTDGTLIVTFPIACVMIMVLLFEVPLRIVMRAGGFQEIGTAAPLVRLVLSFWVLFAGAAFMSEVVADRYTALLKRVLL